MRRRKSWIQVTVALILSSCGRGDPGERPADEARDPAALSAAADAERLRAAGRRESARLQPVFEAELRAVGDDVAAIVVEHRLPYLPAHGLDVARAEFYPEFVSGFALDDRETATLGTVGFVVLPQPVRDEGGTTNGAGPADLYYRVFERDLPVFVSADSILHAWHRSYGEILQVTEEAILRPELERVLTHTVRALPQTDATRDARLYLEVGRKLLDPDAPVAAELRAEVGALVAKAHVAAIAEVQWLGRTTEIDFSQFTPRGHYASTPDLQSYLRAMMWLGRVDLVLFDRSSGTIAAPRHEVAARQIADALADSGTAEAFATIAGFYRVHVGEPNAVFPTELRRLCSLAGAASCTAAGDLTAAYRTQDERAYATTPAARPAAERRGEIAMRLFPQRFAYDAWVTSKVTSPELLPGMGSHARTMASPLDVAFALGSDRALEHMAEELAAPGRELLAPRLAAARRTLAEIEPVELDETIYNHWLEALRALAKPRIDDRYPTVMRTATWHDRQLEAVLASWAELRHDTILIVDQSMGTFGCQYPKGYVEPVPEVFAELSDAAAHLATLYAADGSLMRTGGRAELGASVRDYLAFFQRHMARLSALAELELAGEPMSADDLAFLQHTVDKHAEGYAGVRTYDGWYPTLYWTRWWQESNGERGRDGYAHVEGGMSRPLVSDVHTDGANGKVLEVAVGYPELMIVAIDQRGAVALYGGPVYAFHAFEQPLSDRLTDEAWTEKLDRGETPERPSFARRYRAE